MHRLSMKTSKTSRTSGNTAGRHGHGTRIVATAAILLGCGRAGTIAAAPAATPAAAASDAAPDVDELLSAARRKADAGATAEALADLRAANAAVKQAKGADAVELLQILDMAADVLVADGQMDAAEAPLKRAVAVREALVAKGVAVPEADVAGSLATLGTVRAARGGFTDAKPLLARAVAVFEKTLGATDASTTATLLRLAEVRLGLGETAAAQDAFREAMERARDRGGDGDAEFPVAAGRLARALASTGQPAAGVEVFAAALADHRRAVGDRPELASLLRDLAELQLESGDAAAAAAAADDALDIDRSHGGDDHPATATDRLLRVRADVAAGDGAGLDEADTLASRLAADAAGGDEPLAAAGLRCAAVLAADVQDAPRALERWRRALEADRRLLGEEHPDTAADRTGLARCILAAGNAAEARSLADAAAVAFGRARGPAHTETLEAVAVAGGAATMLGDLSSATKLLDRVLAANAPRSGPHADRDLARLSEGVAALKEQAGDAAGAAAARDAALEVRQRQFGDGGPEVAAMLVQLAEARHDGGAPAAAVPLYELAVSLASETHGSDHPEVAAILTPLARSLRAADANEAAAGALGRALAIWEATVGPDHPTTLATVKALALVHLALDRQEEALPLMTRLLAGYDADPSTPPADVARLLRKLGQIHAARGDAELARGYSARAETLEKRAAASASPSRPQDRR